MLRPHSRITVLYEQLQALHRGCLPRAVRPSVPPVERGGIFSRQHGGNLECELTLPDLLTGRRACCRGPGRRAPRQPKTAVTPLAPRSRVPPTGLRASPSSPPGRRARPASQPGAARASSSSNSHRRLEREVRARHPSPSVAVPVQRPVNRARGAPGRKAKPAARRLTSSGAALAAGLRSPRAPTGPCWTVTTTKGEGR